MKLPKNKTEQQVLDAIEKVIAGIAPSFVFGYFDKDDILQQARLFCIQAMDRYDGKRPLENFLCVHVKNRLINLKRDLLRRSDKPCAECHDGRPCQPNGKLCQPYMAWLKRNNCKSNLMRPLDLNYLPDEKETKTKIQSSVEEDAQFSEMLALIDDQLPVELRQAFLQLKEGVSIPKVKKDQVIQAVREILKFEVGDEE